MDRQLILGTCVALGLLSGCATLNSQFDCPMKPGVLCKSLDEVNQMVDQGKLGGNSSKVSCYPTIQTTSTTALATCSHPTRQEAPLTRIWIAPYEDNEGDYYGPRFLYTGVRPYPNKVRNQGGKA